MRWNIGAHNSNWTVKIMSDVGSSLLHTCQFSRLNPVPRQLVQADIFQQNSQSKFKYNINLRIKFFAGIVYIL